MKSVYKSAVCLAVAALAVNGCDASNTSTGGFAGSPGPVFGTGGSGAKSMGGGANTTLIGRGGSGVTNTLLTSTGGSSAGVTAGAFAQACNTFCARKVAAGCTGDVGVTLSDCVAECNDTTGIPAACLVPYQAYAICMAGMSPADFGCDTDGFYSPTNYTPCETSMTAMLSCAT